MAIIWRRATDGAHQNPSRGGVLIWQHDSSLPFIWLRSCVQGCPHKPLDSKKSSHELTHLLAKGKRLTTCHAPRRPWSGPCTRNWRIHLARWPNLFETKTFSNISPRSTVLARWHRSYVQLYRLRPSGQIAILSFLLPLRLPRYPKTTDTV